ncbi:MAG TPA: hypothetical protein VN578_16190 [Candidatus Binatia bacterium]|jgi:hypothetical protein|nr:hypothetical protein [Candidatus Binatia bacterium]
MKNLLTLFLAGTTLVLGCVCVFQWQKLRQQQSHLAAERADAEANASQIAALESVQKQLEQQRDQLRHETEEMAGQLLAKQPAEVAPASHTNSAPVTASLRTEPGKPDGDSGGFGKMVSKMMHDPNMKKIIVDQQSVMMNQLYAPLIKQMGLNPDEAAKFKDLLAENMAKSTEQATSLFDGASSTNRATMASNIAEQQKQLDEQLKAVLGDARFTQYKDYQQTSGERMQLNVFKQQTAGSDNPLTDPQTEQLLAFMKEEKQSVAAATGQPSPDSSQDPSKSLDAMLSEEQGDKLLQSQETLNQRVFERARTILSPDQLDAFGKYQSSQLQMMRMGMSMARKFFVPEKAAQDAPPPVPVPQ